MVTNNLLLPHIAFGEGMGIFKKFFEKLKYTFTRTELDEDFYDELESLLVSSDMGVEMALSIIDELKSICKQKLIKDVDSAQAELKNLLTQKLNAEEINFTYPLIITVSSSVEYLLSRTDDTAYANVDRNTHISPIFKSNVRPFKLIMTTPIKPIRLPISFLVVSFSCLKIKLATNIAIKTLDASIIEPFTPLV